MAIIAVDVDDVCLDLVTGWIKKYNKEYGKNIKKETMTDWDFNKFLGKGERERFFQYIEDDEVFLEAKPIENALSIINWLKNDHRVIYVTANDPKNCKFSWLLKHGFINHIEDLVVAYDKGLILSNILIDDRYENVKDRNGGWLFSQPWNKKYNFKNRVNNWLHFKELIEGGQIL